MFNPFSHEVLQNPYPYYQRLRDEAPCHYVSEHGFWVLSRYDDIVSALSNHAVFSSTGGVGPTWDSHPMMSMYDPPEHTRLRRIAAKHFTPVALEALSQGIERSVVDCLLPAIEVGHLEVIEQLAIPVALGVMANIIGMPRDQDENLKRWAEATTDQLAAGLSATRMSQVESELKEFVAYLRLMLSTDGQAAGPRPSGGVLTHLIGNAEDGRLTKKELIAFAVLLLAAGFGTTAIGIANTLYALSTHPGEWRRLQENPSLTLNATEESIRWDGAVQSFFRNTLADVSIGGQRIPSGSKVMILFGSANRDERQFANPDTYIVDRKCDNVAYGSGIHHCLGAALARLVMGTVVRSFLKYVDEFELTGPVLRDPNVLFRVVTHMPLAIRRRVPARGSSLRPLATRRHH